VPTTSAGPSMRHGSTNSSIELLIKTTLEEEGDEGGLVERIAEKIARGGLRSGSVHRRGTELRRPGF
jgi:serine/threonine-protein phosphatase 2B catalytic subunit